MRRFARLAGAAVAAAGAYGLVATDQIAHSDAPKPVANIQRRARPCHRIEAEILIPGRGRPIRDGVVVFADDGTIAYAGERANAPPDSPASATVKRVHTVMPGMWDCHARRDSFLGWTPCFFAAMVHGLDFHSPRIALPFHDRSTSSAFPTRRKAT